MTAITNRLTAGIFLSLAAAGCLITIFPCRNAPASGAEASAEYVNRGTWPETMTATRVAYLQSPAGKRQQPLTAFFRPYDSGLIRGDGPAQHVSLDITGVKTLRLITICEQGVANCNIWGEPKLFARDAGPKTAETRLTTLTPTHISVGWGQMLLDKNWQNHPLRIGDKVFQYGFWVHANSELRFDLNGRYNRFEAYIGEDKDRPTGAVRFKVLSGEPPPMPSAWPSLAADYPIQSGCFVKDAGREGVAAWFADRRSATQPNAIEQMILGRVLAQIAPADRDFRNEADRLVQNNVPPADPRWLQLYAQLSRYRECLTVVRQIESAQGRADLEKELAALASAKTPSEDGQWAALLHNATHRAEVDSQYATLTYDLQQRAAFDKVAHQAFRPQSLILPSDRDPADIVLRRTVALLSNLDNTTAAPKLLPHKTQLAKLRDATANTPTTDVEARRALFAEICSLRRRIALANPLLDFDQILFIKRHRSLYGHMCDQYYGITAVPGGGIYILQNPFGANPQVRNLLAKSLVENGRLKGRRLSGGPVHPPQLSYDGVGRLTGDEADGGAFLSPSLSYDAKSVLFAYVECKGEPQHRDHTDPTRGHWDEGRCYHIFKVNVDGSGLQQLTDGTWNDFDPCWLPNGRIAFISERRGGYLRCGRVCPLYTLYEMAADGSGINCLSFHESNEWHPSVTRDGQIVYTRWDYVDRHGCTAHMPWITRLDGTDSRALHGNFAPRHLRPDMELSVRAIPDSHKFVATAAPHHGFAYGSLVTIDPRAVDDDAMGPLKRLTPDVAFPESQGGRQAYGAAWPLSEDYYLCVYDDSTARPGAKRAGGNYGIYLLDSFGNKELIYRDPYISCLSPIPLRPTPVPPSTPAANPQHSAATTPVGVGHTGEASVAIINVLNSTKPWPDGTRITELRVLQLLPMSVPSGRPPHQTGQRIAEAGDSVVPVRWVLGTAPVEPDGSAHFTVPAYRELFFQALDERGMAVQSMRSATYARNGERLLCQGCHEPKPRAPRVDGAPMALRRPPSKIKPDVDGSNPFSYARLVQPTLDRTCVPCHTQNRDKAPNLGRDPIHNKWYASYNTLIKYGFTSYEDRYRTLPGRFGARASKLIQMLTKGHHDLKLTDDDFHRIVLWLDCASMFYGVFEKEGGEAQLRGEIATATLE